MINKLSESEIKYNETKKELAISEKINIEAQK